MAAPVIGQSAVTRSNSIVKVVVDGSTSPFSDSHQLRQWNGPTPNTMLTIAKSPIVSNSSATTRVSDTGNRVSP